MTNRTKATAIRAATLVFALFVVGWCAYLIATPTPWWLLVWNLGFNLPGAAGLAGFGGISHGIR